MGFLSGPTIQRSTSESSSTFQSAVIRNSAFGLTPSTLALVGATATMTTERMHRSRSARPIQMGDWSLFIYRPLFGRNTERRRPDAVWRAMVSGALAPRGGVAEPRSAVFDAHDLDELAFREVAERRALGEVLLGLDAAPQFARYGADNRHVSRISRRWRAILRLHSRDANHGDDVETHGLMLLLGLFPQLSLTRRRHSVRFSRLDVIPIRPPIMSRATRRRSETTASARQGVASLGTKPRQSRTPAPSMTIRVTIGQRMRADSVLGFPQPGPSRQRDVGRGRAVSRPEAGRAEPVGRDRATDRAGRDGGC